MTTGTAALTAPADTGRAWFPDLALALAAEPVLPLDPDAGWLPVLPEDLDELDDSDGVDVLTVYDLVDSADRADLERLTRLDWADALEGAAGETSLADPVGSAGSSGGLELTDESDPAGLARLVARVADGADPDGAPIRLVDAVAVLSAVDPQVLGGASRVDLIRGWERVAAMVAGAQQVALAAVADATAALGLRGMEARHEVGAALRLAPGTAAERTEVALALTGRLTDTLAALRRGDLSWRQTADLAVAVRDLPDPLAARVQARVLPTMPGRTASESRRAVQAAVIAADPDGAAARATKAVRDRRIERLGQPDSMASWWLNMPARAEGDLWAEVTRRARAAKKAQAAAGLYSTGLDALRVDALIDALLGPGAADRLIRDLDTDNDTDNDTDDTVDESSDPDADDADPDGADSAVDEAVLDLLRAAVRGRSPYLPMCSCGGKQVAAVVVDLPTALALADNPGVIPGYGTIPPALARAMAADRDWVQWTRDPGTRQVIDRGADTYRPSDKMLAFLAARDRVCGFPGCARHAQDCDCDHVINHTLPNGQTIAINLGPLCRQHHNAKTHGRWQLTYNPKTHTKTWTSPLGRTYSKGTDPPLH
ncbi:MAG TPA: DUF222 domain-containing protein [Mycobacterium sp.]|nr:DUF222 domain-containing protein [Mycobacterium sp.]